ncbi:MULTISPECIES: 2'-5' RNA ligase family protein [unclassified Streptomyces]|uniref:2'-5' RNA ligase family protein n=1 Tax=unclassified Streptomyces TaxID=2593676 RepID=UPI0003A4D867|nr:2'-5' RNA ligase family protein [Streptomyces sp. BoleA5]
MGNRMIGVSIAVPEPYGSLLQQRRAGYGDPLAYCIPTHVTLLPPTEVDTALLPAFREHLAEVAATGRAFPMRLEGTASFRPVTPVVYIDLVQGALHCAELQERVRSGPVRRELQFPYHPHVTIGHGIPDEALDRAETELADFAAAWTVSCFSLYEQDDEGVWRSVRDYPFGGAPGHSLVPHQTGACESLSPAPAGGPPHG